MLPRQNHRQNGTITQTVYDYRGLLVSRTTSAGTPNAKTILTDWHPNFRKAVKQVEPGKVTFSEYDSKGLLTKRIEGVVKPGNKKFAGKSKKQLIARIIGVRVKLIMSAGYSVIYFTLTPILCDPDFMMQSIGRMYARYFNYTYQRSGTLWEGRFKSSLIQSEKYLLELYRYIELNPVRADMVDEPSEYSWSSYGCNALGVETELQTPHELYLALGKTKHGRLESYR